MKRLKYYQTAEDADLPRGLRLKKGGSSAPQTTTTVQNNAPWGEQQPYLKFGFQQAQDIYNSNKPEYFPGQTVTPFNQNQNLALDLGANRALAGNPLNPAAQGQALSTINGDYLNAGNPYTGALTNSIEAAIRPGIDSRFNMAGRAGSTAHAAATTTAMTNALAPLLFNQYGQERANQLNTMAQAPNLAQADYNDINALGNIGLTQQQQQQNQLNSDIERFNFGQNVDANKLANYMQLIGGNYGGSLTSTQTGPAPGKGGSGLGAAFQGLGALGSAAGGAGAAYTAFSDRRLKTDIVRIGDTPKGVPVYEFSYLWSPERHIGCMADEVEQIIPEAVGMRHGFKTVNYAMVQ